MQLLLFGVPYDREQIAAHAIAGRFHKTHDGIARDCRINCVAACLENIEPGLYGQRLAGGDHAVLRHDFGTGGEGLAKRPVVAIGGEGGKREGHKQIRAESHCFNQRVL